MLTAHVLFDMNGTLFDPASIVEAVDEVENAPQLVELALGQAISAAMVETVTGRFCDFSELQQLALSRHLELAGRPDLLDAATEAAKQMQPFPEARAALERLRAAGIGTGVLTNSSTESAEQLCGQSNLDLDPIIGTDRVEAFKPDRRVYECGVRTVGENPSQVILVAAHWWDIAGAKRAGLQAGYVSRSEAIRLALEPEPDYEGSDLAEVAASIAESTQ